MAVDYRHIQRGQQARVPQQPGGGSVTAETSVLDTLADLTADVLHGLYSGGAS